MQIAPNGATVEYMNMDEEIGEFLQVREKHSKKKE